MGYFKNAMASVHEAGCVWIEPSTMRRLASSGIELRTKHLVVEGFDGPVEIDAPTADEARRVLPLLDGECRSSFEEALQEFND